MGRRPRALDPTDPLQAFAIDLRALRDAAGATGTAVATCNATGITRTTYYAWLAGTQLPGRDVLEPTVRLWGGDVTHWLSRRRQVEENAAARTPSRPQLHHTPTQPHSSEPADEQKIQEAKNFLKYLGFDAEQRNTRSCYVLLALAELGPGDSWQDAKNPILRLTEVVNWIREAHGKNYAPNTRETIRRFTLNQFIEKHIVVANPDRPDRPVNSPKWCYQLSPRALDLVQEHGQDAFWKSLGAYHRSSMLARYLRPAPQKP
ncbi:hypothetical protein [Streptomyces sp. NPDC056401]|uniref:hypothetical protein n=1 Tax=Streptomyces sp. NPDC056401 TaxID=3345809 RepID=UPI0035E2E092